MLLTRAARKKAGHSPLPSLFKDALQPVSQPQSSPPPKATIQHPIISDNFSSSEEEEKGRNSEQLWVQCEQLSCGKWRLLNKGATIDTNSAWYCYMHPDPSFQSCNIPEQEWKQSKKRRYTFTKLRPGQLVWAKMNTFSPWPAIVTPDPWSDNECFSEDRIGCIYHVEFLGRNRTHLWLAEEKVEPYLSRVCSLGNVTVKTGLFKAAVMEADVLADLRDSERLETCQYTDTTGGRKPTQVQQTLNLNTGKAQRQQKEAANCKAVSCGLGNAQDLASLEKVLSQSNFDLKEFIQTNFKIDSSGVVSLATFPKCTDAKVKAVRQGSWRQRRKRIATSSQSDGNDTPKPKPGRKPRRRNKNANSVHVAPAAGKRVSPTIPDYFNDLTPTPTGCSGSMVCTRSNQVAEEVRLSHEVDQVVPGAGGLSAEAQAMRELEEIEGLLTMFEDSGSKMKSCGENGSKMKPGGEPERAGSDLTLFEDSKSEGELKRACYGSRMKPGGMEACGGSKMKPGEERALGNLEESDNTHSEWMDSVLGEIDQIEGTIKRVSVVSNDACF